MSNRVHGKQILPLGQCYITPGARDAFIRSGANPLHYLSRHASGDWGDVCAEDKALNNQDVEAGNRILSAYHLSRTGQKIWIITEADRSATTILLPDEY